MFLNGSFSADDPYFDSVRTVSARVNWLFDGFTVKGATIYLKDAPGAPITVREARAENLDRLEFLKLFVGLSGPQTASILREGQLTLVGVDAPSAARVLGVEGSFASLSLRGLDWGPGEYFDPTALRLDFLEINDLALRAPDLASLSARRLALQGIARGVWGAVDLEEFRADSPRADSLEIERASAANFSLNALQNPSERGLAPAFFSFWTALESLDCAAARLAFGGEEAFGFASLAWANPSAPSPGGPQGPKSLSLARLFLNLEAWDLDESDPFARVALLTFADGFQADLRLSLKPTGVPGETATALDLTLPEARLAFQSQTENFYPTEAGSLAELGLRAYEGKIRAGSLQLADRGLAAKLYDALARVSFAGEDPRGPLADLLTKSLLGYLGDALPDGGDGLARELAAFIGDPQSLEIRWAPQDPFPQGAIARAARRAPDDARAFDEKLKRAILEDAFLSLSANGRAFLSLTPASANP
jgi:hypothetical protein